MRIDANGNISFVDSVYQSLTGDLITEHRNTSIIAPLFDLYDSPRMGIVFKEEYFFSKTRSVSEISAINVIKDGMNHQISFDEIFYFVPDDTINTFQIVISYNDNETISNLITINTPEYERDIEKGLFSFDKCAIRGVIPGPKNVKLEFCMIPSCGNNSSNPRIYKPYILVTGYRPPKFGQTFRKTWKFYNKEHDQLLNQLRDNGYDVFLVKFNMSEEPDELGMFEASSLLEDFIIWVNVQKGGQESGQENIIQGSSMGETVTRLTLLRMEKKHFEIPNYPNHHSRLNIAYDGNFYGANLPYSYQAQIFSVYTYPRVNVGEFITSYLVSSLTQKATRELLTYHIQGHFSDVFHHSKMTYQLTPTHHWRR